MKIKHTLKRNGKTISGKITHTVFIDSTTIDNNLQGIYAIFGNGTPDLDFNQFSVYGDTITYETILTPFTPAGFPPRMLSKKGNSTDTMYKTRTYNTEEEAEKIMEEIQEFTFKEEEKTTEDMLDENLEFTETVKKLIK